MPSSVKTVPVSSVVTMLICFLLAISVGDYLLLGWLNRRILTWVLFPLVSIGFTVHTISLARSHVGATDFTTALTVVDTNVAGRPLRSSRFEMIFTAAERQSQTKVKNSIFSPLGKSLWPQVNDEYDLAAQVRPRGYRYSGGTTPQDSPSQSTGFMEFVTDPPLCTGVPPGAFTIERNMRKWTPQIGRFTRIGAAAAQDLPEFDWNLPDTGPPRTTEEFVTWAEQMESKFPGIEVRQFGAVTAIWPEPTDESSEATRSGAVWSFVKELHDNRKHNAFCFVSQLAPTGGAWLEDLPNLDTTAAAASTSLVAVVPADEDFFVFRYKPASPFARLP